jgi:hypothetical protein
MKKLIVSLLGLLVAIAHAQPKKDPPKDAPKEQPKVGANETLQNGGDERPWATGVSASEQEAALALFREGNGMLNDGLGPKAADKYREALKHWDHPAISYNLGVALLDTDPIAAYEQMQRAIRFGSAPLQSKDKFDSANRYLKLLEQEIAEIEVSCDKAGAKVLVDGKEAFVAPGKYSGRVRIGKHTFVAERSGYTTRVRAPFIGPGEKFRIELKLYTADELTRYKRRWNSTWMPYVVIGSGAVLAIVGGGLEAAAQGSYHKFDETVKGCNMGMSGCPDSKALTDIIKRGDNEKAAGFVMYGIGAATVAVGATLLFLNRRQPYLIRAEDLNEGELSFAPIVTPSYAGAAMQGRF